MYSFENIIGERNSVLSPVINEKISKTSVFIALKRPIVGIIGYVFGLEFGLRD